MICNQDAQDIAQRLIMRFGSTAMESHPDYYKRKTEIAEFLQSEFNEAFTRFQQKGGNQNEVSNK